MEGLKNLGNKSHFGLIATNRDYQIGGSGSVVELDSLINFLDRYTLDLNFAKSNTQEGQIDFIGSNETFFRKNLCNGWRVLLWCN